MSTSRTWPRSCSPPGMIVGYGYAMEFFIAWYSGQPLRGFVFINRATGPYAWRVLDLMIFCNVIVPQLFWFKKRRTNILPCSSPALVNVGMWFERFVIIVTSLHRDFLPVAWGMYYPTWVDITLFLGPSACSCTCFLLFLRSCRWSRSRGEGAERARQHRPAPAPDDRWNTPRNITARPHRSGRPMHARFETRALVSRAQGPGEGESIDTYSPYPLHGGDEALGLLGAARASPRRGLTGMFGGYLMMVYMNAWNWPLNVGGRPPHAPPSFIPITFETTVLLLAVDLLRAAGADAAAPAVPRGVRVRAVPLSAVNDGFCAERAPALKPGQRRHDAAALASQLGAKEVSTVKESVE